mgnify:FL=1
MRWHRKGKEIRDLLFLGVIAKKEIQKNSKIGLELKEMKKRRKCENKKRRK